MTRRWIRPAAGLLVAAAFVWLAFGRLDWGAMERVLAAATPAPIALGLVALAAGFGVRITRWWTMLAVFEPSLRLRACVRPFLLSLAVNNTVPLRAGDIVRAVGFRQTLRVPTMRVVGTLVIERILDLLVLVALFFVGLLGVPAGVIPRPIVLGGAALGATAVLALLVLVLAPGVLFGAAERILASRMLATRRWVPRARTALAHLFESLALLRAPGRALHLLGLSLLAWILEGSLYASVAWALHADGSALAPWFACATGTLATLIPSSPGYVGTFDYFAILGMMAYGAGRAVSAAFAMVVHLLLWLPVTLVGAAYVVLPGAAGTRRVQQAPAVEIDAGEAA
jgi:uncharacterized protein (TIRG00374 family)